MTRHTALAPELENRFRARHLTRLAAEIRFQKSRPGRAYWRAYQQDRSPEEIASIVLYSILRSGVIADDDLPARQTVAAAIAKALGAKDGDSQEVNDELMRVGLPLLRLAARAGVIERLFFTRPKKGEEKGVQRAPKRTRLTDEAWQSLGDDMQSLVSKLPDDPLTKKPTDKIQVSKNRRGKKAAPPLPATYEEALEVIRGTPWRVNKFVLDVMLKTLAASKWRYLLPRTMKGGKRRVPRDADRLFALEVAKRFKDHERFYLDVSLDFRGRVYQHGTLRFNGASGPVQALLEFADGELVVDDNGFMNSVPPANNDRTGSIAATLDDMGGGQARLQLNRCGAMYLAAYVASLMSDDEERGRKRTIEELSQWTLRNDSTVLGVAHDPFNNREWRKRPEKKRWKALAACDAWRRFREGKDKEAMVHLPVSLDASTSGLQMYAMLVRDEALAAKVGLMAGSRGTFYEDVARECGDSRAAAKAVGIPLFYGNGEVGTLEALAESEGIQQKKEKDGETRFSRKKRLKFNREKRGTRELSLTYRNLRLRAAIQANAPAFGYVRNWLTRLASAFGELDKSFTWTTPLGLAVVMDYRKPEGLKIYTKMKDESGKQRRLKTTMTKPSEKLDPRGSLKGIAANVVHSLDSNVLIATVQEGAAGRHGEPRILNWGVVHDCFAVHPNYAHHLRVNASKDAIRRVFLADDWLSDLYEQFKAQAEACADLAPSAKLVTSLNVTGPQAMFDEPEQVEIPRLLLDHPKSVDDRWLRGYDALTF